jgi:excisionase family DNA binding protein
VTAPLRTFEEAAAILSIPASTLKKAVTARRIPHTRIGRHIRFTDDDIARIVAMHHVDTGPTARAVERRARLRSATG